MRIGNQISSSVEQKSRVDNPQLKQQALAHRHDQSNAAHASPVNGDVASLRAKLNSLTEDRQQLLSDIKARLADGHYSTSAAAEKTAESILSSFGIQD